MSFHGVDLVSFQSPFNRGSGCNKCDTNAQLMVSILSNAFSPLLIGEAVVTLHELYLAANDRSFSPLLIGEAVVTQRFAGFVGSALQSSFSPLLIGEAVVTPLMRVDLQNVLSREVFQSPFNRGSGCNRPWAVPMDRSGIPEISVFSELFPLSSYKTPPCSRKKRMLHRTLCSWASVGLLWRISQIPVLCFGLLV